MFSLRVYMLIAIIPQPSQGLLLAILVGVLLVVGTILSFGYEMVFYKSMESGDESQSSESKTNCPACGARISTDQENCDYCGESIAESA